MMSNWSVIAIILLQSYASHSIGVCDDICTCGYRNNNEDYLGEKIDCSFKNQDLLINNYTLPNVVCSLDLSSNNLISIQKSNLLRSDTLLELYLNRNNITDIAVTAFALPELKILDLSFNNLEYIDPEVFRGLNKLEYLNLANNKFTAVSSLRFHHLNNLNKIVLDFNRLGPSMMEINLFDRNGFGLTNKIRSLSIKGIGLDRIPDNFFADLYDIRQLTISDNTLEDIFELPTTLEYLDLSNNPIKEISEEDFVDVPGLRKLKLNNLLIKEVPDYVFAPLPGLLSLDLERNRNLTHFSRLAFGHEVLEDADDFLMEKLSLKGSRLSKLDEDLLKPFGRLFQLDLQGNPWVCDCDIVWVKRLQINPKDYDYVRCALPRSLYNSRIFELEDKYFMCKSTKRYIGVAISIITLFVATFTIMMWILKCIPKRKLANYNMFNPYIAYTTLSVNMTT